MPKQKDDPDELAATGSRIASARIHAGLGQKELAALIQMDQQNLSKVERGGQATNSAYIRRMCPVLKVSADYIVSGIEDPSQAGFIDPRLLWESGVQRVWQANGGGDLDAEFVKKVREGAKQFGRFTSIEELDAAVAEVWRDAQSQRDAGVTVGPGKARLPRSPEIVQHGAPTAAFLAAWNAAVVESIVARPGPSWLEAGMKAAAYAHGRSKAVIDVRAAVAEVRTELELQARPPAAVIDGPKPSKPVPPKPGRGRSVTRRKSQTRRRGGG